MRRYRRYDHVRGGRSTRHLLVRLRRRRRSAYHRADQLTQRPRLKRAAARSVRRIAVGDLEHMPKPPGLKLREQRHEKTPARLIAACLIVSVDAEPCIDEGPDQPWPNSSLVIRGVSGHEIPMIFQFVAPMSRL